jgi:hypothetical protein
VPNDSHGRWAEGAFGRRKDADRLYNEAAFEVMARHPEIRINDLNRFVRQSQAFDAWRKQADVHFWQVDLQELLGRAVADALGKAGMRVGKTGEKQP